MAKERMLIVWVVIKYGGIKYVKTEEVVKTSECGETGVLSECVVRKENTEGD
jgi:hypothetical protein